MLNKYLNTFTMCVFMFRNSNKVFFNVVYYIFFNKTIRTTVKVV